MPSEWQVTTLAQAGVSLIDCDHRTPPAAEEGYPYIAIPQLKDGHVVLEGVRRISREHLDEWTKKLKPREHDVIVVRRCNSGVSAVVPRGVEWAIGQNLVVLRADGRNVRPRFLRWLVRGEDWWEQVRKYINVGAVFDSLKCRDIPNFEVTVPPLEGQDRICDVLDAVDHRIDLLRQTNATLESIAQALFKSWFIDFDPVRAKAEGREPEGMDVATAALFPAEFEASALGVIPKGWKAGNVYEIASVIYGAPFASKLFNTDGIGQPLVRIRDLKDEAPGVWTPEVHPKGYLIRPGDIVVGMDGEFRAYLWGGESAWLNQRVCCFQPIAPHGAAFVRCSIAAPLAHIEATEVATTVIHLGKGDIDRFKVVVPKAEVAEAFSDLTTPLYARIVANKAQARSLAAARDNLLPPLISGKLRLPEAHKHLEAARA